MLKIIFLLNVLQYTTDRIFDDMINKNVLV